MKEPLLKIENLRIELALRGGQAPVIDDLSLELNAGETLSFVGESGCGKSMTALAIMGLLPEGVGSVASGGSLFASRCDMADEQCRTSRPPEIAFDDQNSACWKANQL